MSETRPNAYRVIWSSEWCELNTGCSMNGVVRARAGGSAVAAAPAVSSSAVKAGGLPPLKTAHTASMSSTAVVSSHDSVRSSLYIYGRREGVCVREGCAGSSVGGPLVHASRDVPEEAEVEARLVAGGEGVGGAHAGGRRDADRVEELIRLGGAAELLEAGEQEGRRLRAVVDAAARRRIAVPSCGRCRIARAKRMRPKHTCMQWAAICLRPSGPWYIAYLRGGRVCGERPRIAPSGAPNCAPSCAANCAASCRIARRIARRTAPRRSRGAPGRCRCSRWPCRGGCAARASASP